MERTFVHKEVRSADSLRFLRFNALIHKPDGYVYHELVSKNHQGTFRQLHLTKMCLFMHVQLLVTDAMSGSWISICKNCHLKQLKETSSISDLWTRFQVTPLLHAWYTNAPVGRNTLDKVNMMCRNAGLEGHKTNHSLWATGATEMCWGNVPEKLIQERTGHRLLKSLSVNRWATQSSIDPSPQQETVFQEQHSLAVEQSNQTVDIQPAAVSSNVNFSFRT